MTELHPSAEMLVRLVLDAGKPFDWFSDFHRVVELDRLAREQDAPPDRDLPELLDTPLCIGDLTLHRLSWAGVEWYNQVACTWWKDDRMMRDLAIAWIHAHTRNDASIQKVNASEKKARRIIHTWALRVRAPWEAVNAAVDALLPRSPAKAGSSDESPAKRGHSAMASLLSRLVSMSGMPKSYWLFDVSYEHVLDTIREINERSYEEQANMAAMLGTRLQDPEGSWACQSFIRFRSAAKEFLAHYGVDEKQKPKRTTRRKKGKK